MCGIVGSIGFDFDLEAALDRIAHRGPDGRGVDQEGDASHGHVRLALVDLTDASAQPFRFRDGLLSFNGEIWNWRELRHDLEAEGIRFRTEGDTEVLAAALWQWGETALGLIEGMFAFAWTRGLETWLVRDRFGKVPLYVHRSKGERWAWSSERKGLTPLPARMLAPGSILRLPGGGLEGWYDLPRAVLTNSPVHVMLEQGVERRLMADAPLCCLVSGGLDSAMILTIAKRHKPDVVAFTAALRGRDSPDLTAARRLCAELDVTLRVVALEPPTPEDLAAAARSIEIPMKAQVEIAALCIPLARVIASEGFKACLSGEAADELFGGYGSMCIKGSSASDQEWRKIRVEQVRKMARGNFIRCNKAFMAAGVECRLPFMERPLVESVLAMSKRDCPPGKKLLKHEARELGVPAWVVSRQKETFQGGAGLDEAAAEVVPNPAAFYRAEVVSVYGQSAVERGQ